MLELVLLRQVYSSAHQQIHRDSYIVEKNFFWWQLFEKPIQTQNPRSFLGLLHILVFGVHDCECKLIFE